MNSTTKLGTLMVALLGAACSSASNGSTPDQGTDAGGDDSAAATGDDAGDDGAPSGPAYPAGPYGVTVGKVLDPSLEWQGFLPGSTTLSTIKITDLYDPDGSKGINAIVVDTAGQWCVACQAVAKQIPIWLSAGGDGWKHLGVQILNLVIQNNAYEPATTTTAQQWRDLYSLSSIIVAADPSDTFPTPSLPSELLVNPRTMKVSVNLALDTVVNNDGSDPAVAALAKKNGGK